MRTRVGRRRVFGEAGRACDGADFCRGGFAWCLLRGFLARACGLRFAAGGVSFAAEADSRGDGFVALFFFGIAGFKHVVVTEERAFESFAMARAKAVARRGFAFAPEPERIADARVYEADTERHEGESGRCAGGAAEFLCGVRRRAAAVCRTGLPGRAATASRARLPGQTPAKRGGSKLPHSTRALRSREREARGRRNTRRSRGAGSVAPASCRRISAAPPKSQIANNMPFGSGQARVSSEARKVKDAGRMPALRTSVRRCYVLRCGGATEW